jgi:hypothetical protein
MCKQNYIINSKGQLCLFIYLSIFDAGIIQLFFFIKVLEKKMLTQYRNYAINIMFLQIPIC